VHIRNDSMNFYAKMYIKRINFLKHTLFFIFFLFTCINSIKNNTDMDNLTPN
jgi:hypothetical protein